MMTQKTIVPDLKAIAEGTGVKFPADLNLEWVEDTQGTPALRLHPTKKEFFVDDDWVVVLPGIEFTDGVIEFDALGQSAPPQSNFLGVSFRFIDETTHDAVYFRPFNFRAEDPDRKAHAVQYISHPRYHWFDLRRDRAGQYEQPVIPAPHGDGWFHARIVIERPKVSVYVDAAREPSLVVEELSDRTGGGIGLWVGPGQGGSFANLRILLAEKPKSVIVTSGIDDQDELRRSAIAAAGQLKGPVDLAANHDDNLSEAFRQ
jgi:hypothetical protein